MTVTSDTGLDGFVAGLRSCGLDPAVEDGVVTFKVIPVAGSHAGTPVATGVGVEELASWPATPPHWIHLSGDITFPRSNTQASSILGWLKHSRQIGSWGNAAEPVQAWVAHVRSVLSEAT